MSRFQDKDPVDISLFLQDNGIKDTICRVFEGESFCFSFWSNLFNVAS